MTTTILKHSQDFSGENFYIGLDVHKNSWSVTVRTSNLEVSHFSQAPDPKALYNFLQNRYPHGNYYSAYEAGFCGTSSHTALCKLGINNIIVNAADIPNTDKEKKNKTDVHDSRSIAKYLEKGLLHPIYIFSQEAQELRSFYRLRMTEVRDQSRALNRLKGFLNFMGIKIPNHPDNKGITNKDLAWLNSEKILGEVGTESLRNFIIDYKEHREKVKLITKELSNFISRLYPDTYQNLMTIPGIGSLTAIALLTEIGDFNRFETPQKYCSYLGMVPWEHSSGDTIRIKGMQPRCNKRLRPMLIEAAWMAIRKDTGLLLYYKKHAAKNNKHAIIKVARKISLIARGVAIKKQPYNAEYNSNINKNETENCSDT